MASNFRMVASLDRKCLGADFWGGGRAAGVVDGLQFRI